MKRRRKNDGIYKRGDSWMLDCRIGGKRYTMSLGRKITRDAAAEIAVVRRSEILKQGVGIATKRRKDKQANMVFSHIRVEV